MLRRMARLLAALAAVCALPAHALGLGEIEVHSKLNQRFAAVIPVLDASADDLDSLQINLAPADAFERAGIDRVDYLSTVEFKLAGGPGASTVALSSAQPDHEPFLNFLVEARWKGGRLLREYTVLLDPPGLAAASPPAPASVPSAVVAAPPAPAAPAAKAPAVAAAPATPAPRSTASAHPKAAHRAAVKNSKPAAPASSSSPGQGEPAGAGQYGPVKPNETFWSIATRLRPEAATTNQVLLALYEANTSAFDRGRFDGLLSGVTLQVPSADAIESVPADVATARVAQLRAGRSHAVAKPAAASAAAAKTVPAPAENPPPAPPPASESGVGSTAPGPAAATPPAAAGSAAAGASTPSAAAPPTTSFSPVTAPSASAIANSATPPPETPSEPITAPPAEPVTAPSPTAENAAGSGNSPPAGAANPSPAVSAPPVEPSAQKLASAKSPPPDRGGSLFDGLSLPLLAVLIVLVVGFLGWRMTRRSAPVEPQFPARPQTAAPSRAPPPASPASLAATQAASATLGLDATRNLGDTTSAFVRQTIETRPFPVPATTPADSPSSAPVVPAAASTASVRAASQAKAAAAAEPIDFDLTSQFEAQTVAVDLNANDPLSEADFHLAYGLYDEAATLLRQALAKEPERKDLRVKLCETYFAAGRAPEFQEVAQGLHGKVARGEWQKLAIMGRQLSPDAALFKHDGATSAETEVDLPLGEPLAPPVREAVPDFDPGATLAPFAKPAPSPKPATPGSNIIDFDLDAVLQPPRAAAPAKASEPSAAPDIDLSTFDLGADAPAKPEVADNAIEFNLDELDLSAPGGTSGAAPAAAPAAASGSDEIGTKLDLARAYADMGDNEAADGLLKEVIAGGSGAQKQEAEALAKRLQSA